MFCEKCGYKLEEGDRFCEKCGTEVIFTRPNDNAPLKQNESDNRKQEINLSERFIKTKKKRKNIIIISVVVVITLLLSVLIGGFFVDKSIDLTVQEYMELSNNNQLEEYQGYELNITGYLFRDTRVNSNEADGYFAITNVADTLNSSIDNFDMIVFTYNGNIDEDVGSGSEIIVTAKMQDDTDTLLASSVDVLKKTEPIYTVEIEDILNNSKKYDGKKVLFSGRLVNLFGQGQAVTDVNADNIIKIDGLTEKDFATYIQEGSMGSIVGVFKNEKCPMVTIENVKHGSELSEYSDLLGKSVNDCYNDYFLLDGDEISIYGTYYTNFSFSNPTVLADFNTSQFITLTTTMGVDLDDYLVSGKDYVLTGIIREGGTGFILEVLAIG